jgi:hypothetical protein
MKGSDIVLLFASVLLVASTFQQPEKVVVVDPIKKETPVLIKAEPVKTELAKVQEPKVVPKAVEPVIVFHSSSDCTWCDKWEKNIPAWEKLGWRVEKVIDLGPVDGHRLWPWFDVRDRDGRFTVDGFMDGKRFKEAKKRALGR